MQVFPIYIRKIKMCRFDTFPDVKREQRFRDFFMDKNRTVSSNS